MWYQSIGLWGDGIVLEVNPTQVHIPRLLSLMWMWLQAFEVVSGIINVQMRVYWIGQSARRDVTLCTQCAYLQSLSTRLMHICNPYIIQQLSSSCMYQLRLVLATSYQKLAYSVSTKAEMRTCRFVLTYYPSYPTHCKHPPSYEECLRIKRASSPSSSSAARK